MFVLHTLFVILLIMPEGLVDCQGLPPAPGAGQQNNRVFAPPVDQFGVPQQKFGMPFFTDSIGRQVMANKNGEPVLDNLGRPVRIDPYNGKPKFDAGSTEIRDRYGFVLTDPTGAPLFGKTPKEQVDLTGGNFSVYPVIDEQTGLQLVVYGVPVFKDIVGRQLFLDKNNNPIFDNNGRPALTDPYTGKPRFDVESGVFNDKHGNAWLDPLGRPTFNNTKQRVGGNNALPAVQNNQPVGGNSAPPAVQDNQPVGGNNAPPAVQDNQPVGGNSAPPAVQDNQPVGGNSAPPAVQDNQPEFNQQVPEGAGPSAANQPSFGGGGSGQESQQDTGPLPSNQMNPLLTPAEESVADQVAEELGAEVAVGTVELLEQAAAEAEEKEKAENGTLPEWNSAWKGKVSSSGLTATLILVLIVVNMGFLL